MWIVNECFMNITFHGAAQSVTGSCFLVEAHGCRFLIDCGMAQGGREACVVQGGRGEGGDEPAGLGKVVGCGGLDAGEGFGPARAGQQDD